MAIGLGRMFGFTYKRTSIIRICRPLSGEFWRRWHISLHLVQAVSLHSSGRQQEGAGAHLRESFPGIPGNGLWHGASMNFICWGVYYGILIVAERLWIGRILEKIPEVPESSVHPWGGGSGLAAVSGGYPAQRKNTVKGNADSQQGTVESAFSRITAFCFCWCWRVVFCGPIQQLMPVSKRLFDEGERDRSGCGCDGGLLLLNAAHGQQHLSGLYLFQILVHTEREQHL